MKKPDPFEDKAEVITGGGEDGIDDVAISVGEVIVAHTVAAVLEMTGDRFNDRAAFHQDKPLKRLHEALGL